MAFLKSGIATRNVRFNAMIDEVDRLVLFDAMQLSSVIAVCRRSKSLAEAGRKLFGVSREAKSKPNDADRLKKYLARFGLAWDQIGSAPN